MELKHGEVLVLESWQEIPWGLIAPLIVIQLVLAVIALVDLGKVHKTRGPKWMWVPIILCVSMAGPVLYFIIGRKEG